MVKTRSEALTAVHYSLHAAQESLENQKKQVDAAIDSLLEQKFLETDENGEIVASDLGNAIVNAGFAPDEATRLHADLLASLHQGLIFSSHFHLLFIITPYEHACQINWDLFLLLVSDWEIWKFGKIRKNTDKIKKKSI